ncbi:unnamed protein product [Scytosiphon promiscuus]
MRMGESSILLADLRARDPCLSFSCGPSALAALQKGRDSITQDLSEIITGVEKRWCRSWPSRAIASRYEGGESSARMCRMLSHDVRARSFFRNRRRRCFARFVRAVIDRGSRSRQGQTKAGGQK